MKACRYLERYIWSMIKKSSTSFAVGAFFLGVYRHGLRTRNYSALALSDNRGIVSEEKGAVMNAQSSGSTVVVVLVVLAAVIFWPLIAGDEYLFRVWMFILGMPFFDNASLSFMAILSLVGLAALIRAISRSPHQLIHPGAILAGLFSVYAIGYMVTAMRH